MPDSMETIERRKRVRIEPATPADARRIAAKLTHGGTYVPDDIARVLVSLAEQLEGGLLNRLNGHKQNGKNLTHP